MDRPPGLRIKEVRRTRGSLGAYTNRARYRYGRSAIPWPTSGLLFAAHCVVSCMVVTPATAALRFSSEAVSAQPPPISTHAIDIPDLGGGGPDFLWPGARCRRMIGRLPYRKHRRAKRRRHRIARPYAAGIPRIPSRQAGTRSPEIPPPGRKMGDV